MARSGLHNGKYFEVKYVEKQGETRHVE